MIERSRDHGRWDDSMFCAGILPQVSRTFALSIEALPMGLREPIRVAYLLCRIVDSIEDEPGISSARRDGLFQLFERTLLDDRGSLAELESSCRGLGANEGERTLCGKTGAVFRVFRAFPVSTRDAIREHVLDMTLGMRMYSQRAAAKGRFLLRDMGDLGRYCYYVAGTVGELLTDLFEMTTPDLPDSSRMALRERAVSFGLGLQLVNIVKDVASDLERGVVYLPLDLLRGRGVEPDAILMPEHRDAAMEVIRELSRVARRHLERAKEYVRHWPLPQGKPVRLFCTVPLLLALATLEEVERSPDTLRSGRNPRISRKVVGRCLSLATSAVGDDHALDVIFQEPASLLSRA